VQLHKNLLQAANQLQESENFFPSFLPPARLRKVNKYATRQACDLLTQWQGNNRQERLSLTRDGKRLYSGIPDWPCGEQRGTFDFTGLFP
jgi:hypothetical protein